MTSRLRSIELAIDVLSRCELRPGTEDRVIQFAEAIAAYLDEGKTPDRPQSDGESPAKLDPTAQRLVDKRDELMAKASNLGSGYRSTEAHKNAQKLDELLREIGIVTTPQPTGRP